MSAYLEHYSHWTALGQAFPYQTIDELIDIALGFTSTGVYVNPCKYVVVKNTVDGVDYYYANNAYQTIYGGPLNVNGVDGTNALTVIQAAVNGLTTGRTWKEAVILKDGVYPIDGILYLPDYTVLKGEGEAVIQLKAGTVLPYETGVTTTEVGSMIVNAVCNTSTSGNQYIEIDNLTIDFNKANQAASAEPYYGACILLFGLHNTVKNCRLLNAFAFGLAMYSPYLAAAGTGINCRVKDNYVTNCGSAFLNDVSSSGLSLTNGGIYLSYYLSNCIVSNNIVSDCDGFGIQIEDACTKTIVENNITFSNTEFGIWIMSCQHVKVSGNISWGNGLNGILVYNSDYTSIKDNHANTNGTHALSAFSPPICGHSGIEFYGSHNGSCTGNECFENLSSGIYTNSFNTAISSNTCVNNGQDPAETYRDAITLYGTQGGNITGNVCVDNQTPQTTQRGIVEESTADYNMIYANTIVNLATTYVIVGVHTTFKGLDEPLLTITANAYDTIYQNTTLNDRIVYVDNSIAGNATLNTNYVSIMVGPTSPPSVRLSYLSNSTIEQHFMCTFTVPRNWYYELVLTGSSTLVSWTELDVTI
jgi:parallel beta-helix repeat protein